MPRLVTDLERAASLETELMMLQGLRPELIEDVADMDARVAAKAEEMAKLAARRAAKMGALSKMDARIEAIKAQRTRYAAASRASAKDVSPGRKPTDLAADSPESEVDKQYKLLKAQKAARSAKEAARSAKQAAANQAECDARPANSPEHEIRNRRRSVRLALVPASPVSAAARLGEDTAFPTHT